jgi:hypothetical protein
VPLVEWGRSGAGWISKWKSQSVVVRSATERMGPVELEAFLQSLGHDGEDARRLDADVAIAMSTVAALSSLTSPLAVDYLDRLARPVPALTPEMGVQIVGRSYVAHVVVEADPEKYGAADVPVLGTLPPLRRGAPPQDLLVRVVKAARRSFPVICALTGPTWDGLVGCIARRVHDMSADGHRLDLRSPDLRGPDLSGPDPGRPDGEGFVAVDVVDGLARVGWVLRQVDIHYGLEPERRPLG